MTYSPTPRGRFARLSLFAALAVTGAGFVWAYWTTLVELAQRWAADPQYSHGYLVPVFAGVLLWLRRDRLAAAEPTPSGWGLPILAAGVAMRLLGTYYHYIWVEQISLVPCLAGAFLLLGGWTAWRWAWPAVAFLFYMVPLPYRLAIALSEPLQRLATIASTFALQTCGLPAIAEGNVILLNEVEIGIVEACSGLRMLVIFFALTTAVALVTRRPLWEKVLMVASAVPIALLSNLIRITATGILHETVGSEIANAVFHDLAGWLMMPLALGMLWVEFTLLSRLLIDAGPTAAPRLDLVRQRPVPPPSPARQARAAARRAAQPRKPVPARPRNPQP
jgi:exosortase